MSHTTKYNWPFFVPPCKIDVHVVQIMAEHNKVLVLGSGAREHAIACKLLESDKVSQVFVCPGNAGMTKLHSISVVCEQTFDSSHRLQI